MKILLLSCSTGEGHNHCALAVKDRHRRLWMRQATSLMLLTRLQLRLTLTH